MRNTPIFPEYAGFRCIHCHNYVSSDRMIAGVQNRNHCPYCLWSRHLDLNKAGDRLAACKAEMQPIGLSMKHTRKKYGLASMGEFMLIHRCVECGKVSLNRIAADDDAALIYDIFIQSQVIDGQLKSILETNGIHLLTSADNKIVHAQLFGKNGDREVIPR